MPKISKDSVTPNTQGPGTEWRGELDGYTASFVTVKGEADLTPLLKGLPDDHCPSPHWGYVFKGRMWFRDDDREEAFVAGDAFYVQPGHTAGADDGSEFVVFSPTEVMAQVEAHMMLKVSELHG